MISYTATRAKAMKSLLLKKEDYIKMRKMGLNEMIRFLEEREYKKEIDQLNYKGMELINLALNENLANTINKLLSISKESYYVIENYSFKWVVNNLKILIRTKNWELAKKAIVPISPTTYDFCKKIINSPQKEIRKITGVNFQNDDIIEMENELDKSYYSKLLLTYETLENPLKDFYKFLIELSEIKNVMKLKLIGLPKEAINNFVVTKNNFVIKLIDGESINILKNSKYKDFADGIEKDFAKLENNIEKYLLRYSFKLLHLKPLSIAPIFGYLLAKEIEIRNLKLLVNSRALEMDEDFVEENLIL